MLCFDPVGWRSLVLHCYMDWQQLGNVVLSNCKGVHRCCSVVSPSTGLLSRQVHRVSNSVTVARTLRGQGAVLMKNWASARQQQLAQALDMQCVVFETIETASKLRSPQYWSFVHDHVRVVVVCTQDDQDYHERAAWRAPQQCPAGVAGAWSLLLLQPTRTALCYTSFKTTSKLH